MAALQIEDHLEQLPEPEPARPNAYTGHLAGSRFNEEVSCEEVLAWAGCTKIGEDGTGSHWHWPGAKHEKSFTVFPDGRCACWSETCEAQTGIELRHPYLPFSLYAALNFRGNYSAARSAAQGWLA